MKANPKLAVLKQGLKAVDNRRPSAAVQPHAPKNAENSSAKSYKAPSREGRCQEPSSRVSGALRPDPAAPG